MQELRFVEGTLRRNSHESGRLIVPLIESPRLIVWASRSWTNISSINHVLEIPRASSSSKTSQITSKTTYFDKSGQSWIYTRFCFKTNESTVLLLILWRGDQRVCPLNSLHFVHPPKALPQIKKSRSWSHASHHIPTYLGASRGVSIRAIVITVYNTEMPAEVEGPYRLFHRYPSSVL